MKRFIAAVVLALTLFPSIAQAAPQYARPDGDIAVTSGEWRELPATSDTDTFRWNETEEVTADDATTKIASPLRNSSSVNETNSFSLGAVTDPGVDTGHNLVVRARKNTGTGTGIKLIIRLKNGGTTVMTWTTPLLTGTWTNYSKVLTTAQAATVNYADSTLEIVADYSGSGASREAWVTQAYLEVPEAVPPPVVPYRAFKDTSYWNTKMSVNAPIDPNNAAWIADARNTAVSDPYAKLTGAPGTSQDFASPTYFSACTDPVHTINPVQYGQPVTIHIPASATASAGSDGEFGVFDRCPGYDVVAGFWKATKSNGVWTVQGADRYHLSSNGLAGSVAGSDDSYNTGHRGIPVPPRAVRLDEVLAGEIRHRLEFYWHATADSHFWPMSGHESGKGGVVPEGVVIRVKPSVDLATTVPGPDCRVIAQALKDYGAMIGDNAGGSGNRIKLERHDGWNQTDITLDCLSGLTWDKWEFIQGGYSGS